ncbi:MAG: RNA-directed DNA polymerase [Planctomycetes bacterium]|nr:RNA-directed DNA polymerase [Planctomycetota bacterium]
MIAKRSGKPREIAAPLPILKAVQRWILREILAQLPATRYSKAYEAGCSIRTNARFHLRQPVLLLIDIQDFFPSIELPRVYRLFRDVGYRRDVAAMLAGITTLDKCLPQGAPTSPHIANLICRRIDARIGGFCLPQKVRFTRYADDIAISGDFDHVRMIRFVQRVLADDRFVMACGKTRVRFQHQRQCVTGVIVNEYRQADRKVRRRLRQEAYFISRFGLADHMQRCEIEQSNYRQHLAGKANHVRFINRSDRDAAHMLRVLSQLDGKEKLSG